jgi:GTP-binding protein Era
VEPFEEQEEGLLFPEEELPPDHRSGFVTLLGKPNVGKSSLMNAWLGFKIAAVTPKPQTTRNRLLGILTQPNAQIIFLDTPGIHMPRTKLGEYMVTAAREAISEADVLLFLVDASQRPDEADAEIARVIKKAGNPATILVLNKADLLSPEELEQQQAAYRALDDFENVMAISATTGYQRDELLQLVISKLPLGPRFFPEEQITDMQERFIAAEMIREQLMQLLEQEVPHALAVVVQEFNERPNGTLYISATIYTEKDTQKGIVIGRGGAMLKRVGQQAREALQDFFERKVYLDLWVKVRKNWRKDERQLRQLGYMTARDRRA